MFIIFAFHTPNCFKKSISNRQSSLIIVIMISHPCCHTDQLFISDTRRRKLLTAGIILIFSSFFYIFVVILSWFDIILYGWIVYLFYFFSLQLSLVSLYNMLWCFNLGLDWMNGILMIYLNQVNLHWFCTVHPLLTNQP